MKNKILTIFTTAVLFLVVLLVLGIFIKGQVSDNGLKYQKDYITEVGGPFESSNTTSRYILTESLATRGDVLLTEKEARFAAPDVVFHNNIFFSIFPPGVSFLAIPFYLIGLKLGIPQLFTFLTTIVVAIINVFLVAKLASKFGTNKIFSLGAGLTFLFATNALSYSLTLTQHHYSVMMVLLALLNALAKKRTIWNNIWFGLVTTFALLLDVPNVFLIFPIALYILVNHFDFKKTARKVRFKTNPLVILLVISIIPLLSAFGYYNFKTTGSITTIGQSIGQSDYFDTEEKKQEKALAKIEYGDLINVPFNTRKQLSGFYILLISNERGLAYYNLVVLVGLGLLLWAYRNDKTRIIAELIGAVILVNVVMYSAFGDTWGGWSFGPRYLIPTTALLCASLGALALIKSRIKYGVLGLLLVTLTYSIFINTAGALTSAAIPPKVEAEALKEPLPYTYEYNFDILDKNISSSLIFNIALNRTFNASQFHQIMTIFLVIAIGSTFILGVIKERKV